MPPTATTAFANGHSPFFNLPFTPDRTSPGASQVQGRLRGIANAWDEKRGTSNG